MSEYAIEKSSGKVEFDEVQRFLDAVELMLKLGERFVVTIARSAEEVVGRLNGLFAKYGLRMEIAADSDPSVADYLIAAGLGAAGGAAAGAAGGVVAWLAFRTVGALVAPQVAPLLIAGSALGGLLGMSSALAVTHWGLRVRFSPTDSVELQLSPIA